MFFPSERIHVEKPVKITRGLTVRWFRKMKNYFDQFFHIDVPNINHAIVDFTTDSRQQNKYRIK